MHTVHMPCSCILSACTAALCARACAYAHERMRVGERRARAALVFLPCLIDSPWSLLGAEIYARTSQHILHGLQKNGGRCARTREVSMRAHAHAHRGGRRPCVPNKDSRHALRRVMPKDGLRDKSGHAVFAVNCAASSSKRNRPERSLRISTLHPPATPTNLSIALLSHFARPRPPSQAISEPASTGRAGIDSRGPTRAAPVGG